MKKFIMLHVVKGRDGYCLNLFDKKGSGWRIAGVTPWGNPTNIPLVSFKIDYDALVKMGEQVCFEEDEK